MSTNNEEVKEKKEEKDVTKSIEKVLDSKLGELRGDFDGFRREVDAKLETIKTTKFDEGEEEANLYDDTNATPAQVAEQIVTKKLKERDDEEKIKQARAQSDAATIADFPDIQNKESELYKKAGEVWRTHYKPGDLGPPDALRRCVLEADFLLRKEKKMTDSEKKKIDAKAKAGSAAATTASDDDGEESEVTENGKAFASIFGVPLDRYEKARKRHDSRTKR